MCHHVCPQLDAISTNLLEKVLFLQDTKYSWKSDFHKLCRLKI
jgi:hypothetical protein